MTVELGRIGIWCGPLRRGDLEGAVAAATEIEALGFPTAWMPGGEAGLGSRVEALLGATNRLVLATGIVTIWEHPAPQIAALCARVERSHPERFLLGVGVGHAPLVDRGHPGRYRRPIASVAAYLDRLDADGEGATGRDRRLLAAFGPRMLDLAGSRTAGAHPYLVSPGNTRFARGRLGAGPLLAPEQHVVLDTDPVTARALAREYLATYWELPNYVANFRRMGFADADFRNGGSDRLVDELVAWGTPETVLDRAAEHLRAGADHVCLQVLVAGKRGFPLDGWRALAATLRARGGRFS